MTPVATRPVAGSLEYVVIETSTGTPVVMAAFWSERAARQYVAFMGAVHDGWFGLQYEAVEGVKYQVAS
jgi:hypothetical protein